jgi:hypothetical protein
VTDGSECANWPKDTGCLSYDADPADVWPDRSEIAMAIESLCSSSLVFQSLVSRRQWCVVPPHERQ